MSRRRVVLGVCAIGAGALLLSGCNGLRTASKSATDEMSVTQPVKSVRLETGSGNVHIAPGPQALVKRTVFFAGDKPGPTSRVEGDTLVLGDCPQDRCSVDYDVTLPTGASVLGETSSGDVDISGMTGVQLKTTSGDKHIRDISGPVTLRGSSGKTQLSNLGASAVVEASSGDVILSTVKGDVTVQVTSGHVSATDLGGQASVKASSGDVNLSLGAAHNVNVVVSSGNVQVNVPQGTPYRVNVKTSSGNKDVGIATDPSASTSMDLQATSGDVTVSYR
jgi:hypothetical protein